MMKRNNSKELIPILLILFTLIGGLQAAIAQTVRTIKGTISDEQGETLPGASVKVKGSAQATTANANGQFIINVPQTATTLVFGFVGFRTQEVSIGDKTTINVRLRSESTSLNEVVVTGYGQAKRANLTSAQTSVSAKEMNRTVNTTIEQALQGRAAGVQITQNSGQPGGGVSVIIRGISTIHGTTQPLWVVDGIQIQQTQDVSYGSNSSSNPMAGINPSDIEDIQVLQGPQATAQYGSRATNGVVIVTTKRGKAGDMKVGYSYKASSQAAPKRLDVMNLREYATTVNGYTEDAGGQVPIAFLDPSLLGEGTDWQKELFNKAPMQNHNLTLSGGNEKTTYYLSGDYLDQEGVAFGSGFDRYSFRLNLDNKPKKWLTFGANVMANQTKSNLTSSQENIISNAIQLTPQIPVRNFDGSWAGSDLINGANQFAPVNPIAIATLTTNTFTTRQLQGGLTSTINFLKDFKLRTSFSTNINYHNSEYYVPKYKIGYAEVTTATFSYGTNYSTYWNFNQILEYNKRLGKHAIDVMALHESQESFWKNASSQRSGFLTNDILDLRAGDPLTTGNSGGSEPWAMESYLAKVGYNYADRYLITAAIRTDGSSTFGADNKWGSFPSLSAAWRVSGEKFFKVPVISDLKLRVETGLTGNMGYGFHYLSSLEPGASPNGTGFLVSNFPNPGLKWEETRTNNVGFNLGILKNRFEIEFDYFDKKTKNVLLRQPLPDYMGASGTGAVSAPWVNIGTMANKGWAISLNTTNIQKRNFKWTSNLNLTQIKSKVTSLYSDKAFFDRTSWWLDNWTQRSAVGGSPWMFRGYIEEGLFQSIEEINESAVPVNNNGRLPTDEDEGVWVGDIKFKDISGPDGIPDGIIDANDITDIGNPLPKMFGGFSNSFSYKGFDLSVLITGTYGNDVYNYIARQATNPNTILLSRNLMVHAKDYARVVTVDGKVGLENPGTDVPRISYGPNENYARITNKWVEDGSFLRLKNVSLTYNIPPSLVAKQKIVRAARLGFSAQNLFTLTKYKGYDPEVGAYTGRGVDNGNQALGLDYGRYPLTRLYTFSLGVDF